MESRNNDKRAEKGDEIYTRILISAINLISENGISAISVCGIIKMQKVAA